MKKTIQQLWDESPSHKIEDEEYIGFVNWYIQRPVWDLLFYPNVPPDKCEIHTYFGLGNMTVAEAKKDLEKLLAMKQKWKEDDSIRFNRLRR